MRALRKLLLCSGVERRLLAKALIIVPLVRVALWLLPFRVVHRLMRRMGGRASSPPPAGFQPVGNALANIVPAERIVWAVTAVASRVPRATCLTQALAASLLLPRYGHDATLRVGVAKDDHGRLQAHAWLQSGGQTILGEPAPGAFHAFPPLALS